MPTYQYRCASCSRELEVVQKFTDPSLTVCPSCDGQLRKVFSPVGVVFKGSGFYTTDARGKNRTPSGKPGKPDKSPAAATAPDGGTAAAAPAPAKADAPKLSTDSSAAA